MSEQPIAPNASCQICNELHIYLETLEETVKQALYRLDKERTMPGEDALRNVQNLETTLQNIQARLQTLSASITDHHL